MQLTASAELAPSLSRGFAQARRRHRAEVWGIRAVLVLVPVVLWVVETTWGTWDPNMLGSPAQIGGLLGDWVSTGYLWPHLLVTLREVALGFVIGFTVGGAVAIGLALTPRTVWPVLQPFIIMGNAIPRVILAPIFALWFGFGSLSKVMLAALMVFFVMFFNVFAGVRDVNQFHVDSTRALGASESQLVRHVIVPSALVWMLAGIRSSVGFAFLAVIIGEYVVSTAGLGFIIAYGNSIGDVNQIIAGILVVVAVTVPVQLLLQLVEKKIERWRPHAS